MSKRYNQSFEIPDFVQVSEKIEEAQVVPFRQDRYSAEITDITIENIHTAKKIAEVISLGFKEREYLNKGRSTTSDGWQVKTLLFPALDDLDLNSKAVHTRVSAHFNKGGILQQVKRGVTKRKDSHSNSTLEFVQLTTRDEKLIPEDLKEFDGYLYGVRIDAISGDVTTSSAISPFSNTKDGRKINTIPTFQSTATVNLIRETTARLLSNKRLPILANKLYE